MNKFLLTITISSVFQIGFAQEPLPNRPSPLEMVTMKYEDTYVKITYCRPSKNERNIFGELVPFGEVWRTGANEATEITLTGNATIGGQHIEAGTYSMFTIPGKDKWIIIFSSDLGMWGAFSYNPDHDVLRVEGKVEVLETPYEPFTIEFDQKGLPNTNIVLMWDTTRVVIEMTLE